MHSTSVTRSLILAGSCLAVMVVARADAPKAAAPANADAKLITSAMSAAPAKVGRNATIVAMEAGGPDPMCMDANAMEWVHAWVAHKTPTAGKVGFMYMLAGGTDASNTDPYAEKPTAQNHWIKTGPHVMIVGADPSFYDSYPKSADPDTSAPYVMWAGTPYQHLMAPLR
jgi:hypothetical protein